MTTVSLDSIRRDTEAKYASFDVVLDQDADGNPLKVVKLLNVMRLPKKQREHLRTMGERMADDGSNQVEVFRDALATACETKGGAKLLLDAVGEDLALLIELFGAYRKGTQLGEASASES